MAKDMHTPHNTPSGHAGEQRRHGVGHRTHSTPRGHTSGREIIGGEHSTRNTAYQARTPVNRSQVANYTANATQHAEHTHL